jgi:hypothetical protein
MAAVDFCFEQHPLDFMMQDITKEASPVAMLLCRLALRPSCFRCKNPPDRVSPAIITKTKC